MRTELLGTGLFAIAASLTAFYVISNYQAQLATGCVKALSALDCSLALQLAGYAAALIGVLGLVQVVFAFIARERKVSVEVRAYPRFEPAAPEAPRAPHAPPAVVLVACPECRARNAEAAKYCVECGASLRPKEKKAG